MKSTFITLLVYLSISVALAQSTVIEKVWTTCSSTKGLQEVDTRIEKLVTSVEKHHYKNDLRKLNALFMKTHSRFLHSYVQYTGIEGLAKGRYDCLTATSLFADILTRAGYKYNIIETNYHIFIMVKTKDGDVILETTDRFGFINDKKKIDMAIAKYQQNTLQAADESSHQYSFSIYNSVEPDQLPGLLYFNQAVKAFNKEQWAECSEKLSAASQTTNSPRIAELATLLSAKADLSNFQEK
jgi:hypothetical protein